MGVLSRRDLIAGASATGAMLGLGGSASTPTRSTEVDPAYRRADVQYATREPRGTIVVDPQHHYLYYVEGGDRLGVMELPSAGRDLAGPAWPRSTASRNGRTGIPPKKFSNATPSLTAGLQELPGGQGMPGGPNSPLGARALYLWQGNKDTRYRIHGTNEPWKIGSNVSSGCIRMINDDVIDLYDRVGISTKVVVLASNVG